MFLTEINLLKQSAALSDLRFDYFQFPWIFLMFYKEHKAINRSISSAHCFIAHKTVPSHLHVICISAYRFAHRVRPGIFSWNEERWFLFSVLIRLSKGIRDDRDHAARPCTSHPLQWMGASDEESESFLLAQFSVHHSWIWASQNKGKRQPKKNDGGRFYLNFFSSQFFQRGGLLFFFTIHGSTAIDRRPFKSPGDNISERPANFTNRLVTRFIFLQRRQKICWTTGHKRKFSLFF